MPIKIALIDRDGTVGGDGHFTSVADFHPYPGVLTAISLLWQADVLPIILTNQTRIATGEMNEADLRQSLRAMGFVDTFVCPHLETANCGCRKPKTGLVEQARAKYGFQNDEAVVIGDSYQADMRCAQSAGLLGIHVATGRGMSNPLVGNTQLIEAAHLVTACSWILKNKQHGERH